MYYKLWFCQFIRTVQVADCLCFALFVLFFPWVIYCSRGVSWPARTVQHQGVLPGKGLLSCFSSPVISGELQSNSLKFLFHSLVTNSVSKGWFVLISFSDFTCNTVQSFGHTPLLWTSLRQYGKKLLSHIFCSQLACLFFSSFDL